MKKLKSSDKAIENSDEDWFDRKAFASRIVNFIDNRGEEDSIAIGILGEWGEGKTSVINLIKNELNSKTAVIDFNPWQFSDRETLLAMFFSQLSEVINSFDKNNYDEIGRLMFEYFQLVNTSFLNYNDSNSKGLAELWEVQTSRKSIKERKEEVSNSLSGKKKIIVFLDDLDRLSSEELFVVFRLIKLTADFKNIVYILALDDRVVSKMLSERYAGEGASYLEKMIQLPLTIPKAQNYQLHKFLQHKLNEVFSQNDLELDNDESYELDSRIKKFILPFVTNPRVINRLVNSISFLLPLLKGEVYVVDLLSIEWLKIRFQSVYNFIRNNEDLFFTEYVNQERRSYSLDKPNYSEEDFNKKFESAIEGFTSIEEKQIRHLISLMFPRIKHLKTTPSFFDEDFKESHIRQKICSRDHFQRYFTYKTSDESISDTDFSEFFNKLTNFKLDESVKNFIQKHKISEITFKLHIYSSQVGSENYMNFSHSIVGLGKYFPKDDGFFNFLGPFGTVTNIVGELIKNYSGSKRLNDLVQLLKQSDEIKFIWELWFIFYPKLSDFNHVDSLNERELKSFSRSLYMKTKKLLKHRAIDQLGHRYAKHYLLIGSEIEKDEILNLTKDYIVKNKESPLRFLKFFTQYTSSSSHPVPYVSGFSSGQMKDLVKVVDKELLKGELIKVYGFQNPPKTNTDRDPMSDKELVGIYLQYLKNSKKNKKGES